MLPNSRFLRLGLLNEYYRSMPAYLLSTDRYKWACSEAKTTTVNHILNGRRKYIIIGNTN
jgi:hypothetical protein